MDSDSQYYVLPFVSTYLLLFLPSLLLVMAWLVWVPLPAWLVPCRGAPACCLDHQRYPSAMFVSTHIRED